MHVNFHDFERKVGRQKNLISFASQIRLFCTQPFNYIVWKLAIRNLPVSAEGADSVDMAMKADRRILDSHARKRALNTTYYKVLKNALTK